MPPIVIDPAVFVDGADVLARRPEQDVRGGPDVVEALRSTSSPAVLVTSNRHWSDDYLSALRPGDWVTTTGSGFEAFPVERLAEGDVSFTSLPGTNAAQVAEHAIGMVLSYSRRLWTHRAQQRERTWEQVTSGTTHHTGKRCCIVGMGHIGEAIAKRLQAFGMRVHGVKRTVEGYAGHADSIHRPSALAEALRDAAVLVLCAPLTEETHHMIGTPELDRIRDDAIVVNVGRGPTLDADAVLAAIEEGSIRAACLDVTDPEPLPAESSLWAEENVLITSHSAARTDTRTAQFLDAFLELFDRWSSDGTLPGEYRVV